MGVCGSPPCLKVRGIRVPRWKRAAHPKCLFFSLLPWPTCRSWGPGVRETRFGHLDRPVNEVLNQVWLNWDHSSLQSWISRYFVSSYYPWVINVLAPKGRSKTSPKLFQTLYSIDLCINKINTSCGRPGDRTYGIFVKLELSTKKIRFSSAQNQTVIL